MPVQHLGRLGGFDGGRLPPELALDTRQGLRHGPGTDIGPQTDGEQHARCHWS